LFDEGNMFITFLLLLRAGNTRYGAIRVAPFRYSTLPNFVARFI